MSRLRFPQESLPIDQPPHYPELIFRIASMDL